jgi:hypothetical protein
LNISDARIGIGGLKLLLDRIDQTQRWVHQRDLRPEEVGPAKEYVSQFNEYCDRKEQPSLKIDWEE